MHRRQTTTILPSLVLLALCCFQANASALPSFRTNSPRDKFIMNAHENSSGRVQLKKDSNSSSFYVDADFSSSEPSQTIKTSDPVKMMISIANMDTLVSSGCLDFSPYDCSRYNCTTYPKITVDLDFPTFTASGAMQAKSSIFLDYQYWMINSSYFYLASSCQSGDTTTGLLKDRSGVLGLGTGIVSEYYYWYAPRFSILIDSNLTGGELVFLKDGNFNQSSGPLHTFRANDTWQITTDSSASISVAGSSVDLNDCNIMFDVNSDAIGLPNDIYTTLLGYLISYSHVSCGSDNYRPYCYTSQKLEDLPDIILTVNKSQIIIPSKIYATFATTSEDKTFFYFNFKATSPVLSGHSYVSPSFKNSIILDANFMSYYHAFFSAEEGNHVFLFSTTNNPSQPSYAKWIILGVVGVIVVVGVWFWTQKKRASKNRGTAATINTTTDGFDTAKAPLVHNRYDPGYAPPAPVGDIRERAKP